MSLKKAKKTQLLPYSRMEQYYLALVCVLCYSITTCNIAQAHTWDSSDIVGYHFHTYFFQRSVGYTHEALMLRDATQREIIQGFLRGCRLGRFFSYPIGPHPTGSFETCCNASSLPPATSWFMQNRGNLSVLLHPLTRFQKLDHTTRAMWLGPPLPLDPNILVEDLEDDPHDTLKCLPVPGFEKELPELRQLVAERRAPEKCRDSSLGSRLSSVLNPSPRC